MAVSFTPLSQLIAERSHDLGSLRTYCDFDQYQTYKRWLRDDNITFIEGQDSIYVLSTRHKYVLQANCVYWPDMNGELILMTPGEIARLELFREFGKPKNFMKKEHFEKVKEELLSISPPHYYDGEKREGRLYYIDLKGAYWQVYQWLTLDTVHPMGLGDKYLFHLAHRLKDFKLARNSIVGITRSHSMSIWTKGTTYEQGFINPYFNPAIWATIQGVMHEIAWTARTHGACYIATDGYIFDSPLNYGWFQAYLEDNGFNFVTEQGDGYVTGWSSYKVGKKETKIKRLLAGKPLDNIQYKKGYIKWLNRIRNIIRKRLTTDEA